MNLEALKLLRITIIIQLSVAAWFIFAPDTLPDVIKQAEMLNDSPLYETLDSIIVPLAHIQTLLCALLWWPKKVTSWAFSIVILTITILGAFSGPGILSAIDMIFGYTQVLGSGAMLGVLYLYNFFSFKNNAGFSNA